jgi:hypothetical protein
MKTHISCNNDIRYILSDNECALVRSFAHNERLSLYITFHDENSYDQVKQLSTIDIFRLIKIPNTRYDESIIFYHLIQSLFLHKSDFTGVLLYSFIRKGLCKNYINILETNPGYDVYSFAYGHFDGILQEMSNSSHGEMGRKLLELLSKRMGVSKEILDDIKTVMYASCWFARTHMFNGYCKFAATAIDLLESDQELIVLANANANYNRGYSEEKLQKIYKKPYQTMHAFIMERLPTIYFKFIGAKTCFVNSTIEKNNGYCMA